MNEEIWKDIKNYEGYYQVSTFGRIRGLDRLIVRSDGRSYLRKGKILTLILNKDGYLNTKLSKDGHTIPVRVHRIVAETFLPNPDNLPEVNHKDFNRTNNHIENLEWCSHIDNIRYTLSEGRHISQTDISGKKNPNYGNKKLSERYKNEPELAKVQSRPGSQNGRAKSVRLYDGNHLLIKKFDYILECAQYIINELRIEIDAYSLAARIPKYIREKRIYKKKYYFDFVDDNTVPSLGNVQEGVTTNQSIA